MHLNRASVEEKPFSPFKSSSDPPPLEVTKNKLSHQGYHSNQKHSNTKSFSIRDGPKLSAPIYTSSSNWTFPLSAVSKSTVAEQHKEPKNVFTSSDENQYLLGENILKQLDEETKTPVVFLSENNTLINAHSGISVTLPCIIKKESKFEMVSANE